MCLSACLYNSLRLKKLMHVGVAERGPYSPDGLNNRERQCLAPRPAPPLFCVPARTLGPATYDISRRHHPCVRHLVERHGLGQYFHDIHLRKGCTVCQFDGRASTWTSDDPSVSRARRRPILIIPQTVRLSALFGKTTHRCPMMRALLYEMRHL